jgi:hypothetical protein
VTTIDTCQVTDLYRAADTALRASRERWRREESVLMASRDSALRHMVGHQRGGVTHAARELEVSDAQVLRLLDEGITRTARGALDDADVERTDYQLTHQRGGRSIGVVVIENGPSEETVTSALEQRGLVVVGRRPVSVTATDSLRWKLLKALKQVIKATLGAANISSRTYKLLERRGDQMVRLTLTEIMDGMADSARIRFVAVLRDAGLIVDVEQDGSLLISAPGTKDEPMAQELLFSWSDQG